MFSSEKAAFKEAFPYSIPIMATYLLMGAVFGIMMANAGYSPWISLLMSVVIYAGAMQYIAVAWLAGGVGLVSIALISLSVNARQFFYAIACLKRYGLGGWRKWYLIFSVTDETFAMLNLREQKNDFGYKAKDSQKTELKSKTPQKNAPQIENLHNTECLDSKDFASHEKGSKEKNDKEAMESKIHNQKVMFYISLLNHCYWILGCVGGTILGNKIAFIRDIEGLDFIVTATFCVLLYENLCLKNNRVPILIGLCSTLFCFVLDRENFLTYALVLIVCVLLLGRQYVQGDSKKHVVE